MTRQRLLGSAIAGVALWAGFGVGVKGEDTVEQEQFRQVVEYHFVRFPSMEIQDLYKLVFQAAMGSEHAVPNREVAKQWLDRELSTLPTAPPEPLSEPLSPDGALVRVNLRTFGERGGEMDSLLDAFIKTAEQFAGSEERLRRYWRYVEAMAEAEEIPFDKAEVQELFSEMQGFPAVHHSPSYRERYKPAYRVVLLELLGSEASTVTGQ